MTQRELTDQLVQIPELCCILGGQKHCGEMVESLKSVTVGLEGIEHGTVQTNSLSCVFETVMD